ncbi:MULTISPECIES: hypothetical protein [Methylomonas]|uniref:hypothetical protein n=1 Tax=Methylomonas TaxID=416 RepID=UPI001681534F|nr:hypothetical protein [Methylomonas rhizoryzae]
MLKRLSKNEVGQMYSKYRLYVQENIRRGQQDAAQGKATPAEQVLRDIQTW